MSRPTLQWYARRVAGMSAAEVAWRTRDQLRRISWARRQVNPGYPPRGLAPATAPRRFPGALPPGAAGAVPVDVARATLAAADEVMKGRGEVLGAVRTDLVSPDWFFDPMTGRRSPADRYAFRINHRCEQETGNVKQVWELSRHQHLTLLASAWYVTRQDTYAERVADQLLGWWRDNPFLSGIHWTSGIELGVRLISWTWIRRLLDDWPPVGELFEDNELAVRQIRWHQEYLSAFRSRGSSANNHVIAEAAGQLVASCAFPWYAESDRWRAAAARLLERELAANTFPSGVNRELASDYHGFVTELGLVAAVEAAAAGFPLSERTWERLCRMVDAAAALVDERGRPPRQGDSDDGRALVLGPTEAGRWSALLALGGALFGACPWWPPTSPDAASVFVGAMALPSPPVAGRPQQRPSQFADAGITILRTPAEDGPEIWCRCDGGPHGFLSIAGHAHADALSVEVRYGGVDVLADPGTYCYHGEQQWRAYFRSTLAHNTVELSGRSQSTDAGPFLWQDHAASRVVDVDVDDTDATTSWSAEHDGYLTLDPPARHRRTVRLDRGHRSLEIADHIEGGNGHEMRMAFHLGPDVQLTLAGHEATVCCPSGGGVVPVRMRLPDELQWSVHRGETDPILGWYSPAFGRRVPTEVLVGSGRSRSGQRLVTCIQFPMAPYRTTAHLLGRSPRK